jgi:hypothetical protein
METMVRTALLGGDQECCFRYVRFESLLSIQVSHRDVKYRVYVSVYIQLNCHQDCFTDLVVNVMYQWHLKAMGAEEITLADNANEKEWRAKK